MLRTNALDPVGAISDSREPSFEVRGESNNPGVLRWPVDAERCLGFWEENGTNCSNCIAVCRYGDVRGRTQARAYEPDDLAPRGYHASQPAGDAAGDVCEGGVGTVSSGTTQGGNCRQSCELRKAQG